MTIETMPRVDDFVVVVRLKTSVFGIETVRTNREAYLLATKVRDAIKRHVDEVQDANVCVEAGVTLPPVGDWNKNEWE